MKKTVITLSVVFMSIVLFVALKHTVLLDKNSYLSPDGNFEISTYYSPTISYSFPGQGGDGSGYLKLKDLHTGRIITKRHIPKMNAFQGYRWYPDKIIFRGRLSDTIFFPSSYPVDSAHVENIRKYQIGYAVKDGEISTVDSLLNEGGILSTDTLYRDMELFIAARYGDQDMVEFLLSQQDYLTKINKGHHNFPMAFGTLSKTAVIHLIESGVTPNAKTSFGHNGAYYAVIKNNFNNLDAILQLGGQIDFNDKMLLNSISKMSAQNKKQFMTICDSYNISPPKTVQ